MLYSDEQNGTPKTNLASSCNTDCGCSMSLYDPVCANGIQFFTPCHAGCSQPALTGDSGIKVRKKFWCKASDVSWYLYFIAELSSPLPRTHNSHLLIFFSPDALITLGCIGFGFKGITTLEGNPYFQPTTADLIVNDFLNPLTNLVFLSWSFTRTVVV